jgi:hypothetical protein
MVAFGVSDFCADRHDFVKSEFAKLVMESSTQDDAKHDEHCTSGEPSCTCTSNHSHTRSTKLLLKALQNAALEPCRFARAQSMRSHRTPRRPSSRDAANTSTVHGSAPSLSGLEQQDSTLAPAREDKKHGSSDSKAHK